MGKGPAAKRGPRKTAEEVGYVWVIPGSKGRGKMVKRDIAWWDEFKKAGGMVKAK
jgi:hypothetical protein